MCIKRYARSFFSFAWFSYCLHLKLFSIFPRILILYTSFVRHQCINGTEKMNTCNSVCCLLFHYSPRAPLSAFPSSILYVIFEFLLFSERTICRCFYALLSVSILRLPHLPLHYLCDLLLCFCFVLFCFGCTYLICFALHQSYFATRCLQIIQRPETIAV